MKPPTPSAKAVAAADAKADATGQRAAQAKKTLKLAKLRYRSAKKAVKQAKKASRKAAKLARKARRWLDKLQKKITKANTAAVKIKSGPTANPPEPALAHGKR